MNAQMFYDRRDSHEEIDGATLHEIFQSVCGDPSPSGRTPIDEDWVRHYIARCEADYSAHARAGTVGASVLLEPATFCRNVLHDASFSSDADTVRRVAAHGPRCNADPHDWHALARACILANPRQFLDGESIDWQRVGEAVRTAYPDATNAAMEMIGAWRVYEELRARGIIRDDT